MLSTAFLPLALPARSDAGAPQSALTKQLRAASASAFAMAATGVSCDLAPLNAGGAVLTSAAMDGATSMACSPPRTHTHICNRTRRLTVPTAALASAPPRRKRSGFGGGGGGGDEDAGGDGGLFGGGDGGFGGGGGGGDEGASDGEHLGRWLQDAVLLWSVFCAWSAWNVAQHVTQPSPPPRAFAAINFALPSPPPAAWPRSSSSLC
jgi:hypothetical protein